MRQWSSAVRKPLIEICPGDEVAVMGQGWQRVTVPVQPTQQIIFDSKTRGKTVEQRFRGCQWKFPAAY